MGRLDNIIARNKRSLRPRERTLVSFAIGGVILFILALAVFTDLGAPAGEPPKRREPTRIDNVLLMSPRGDASVDASAR